LSRTQTVVVSSSRLALKSVHNIGFGRSALWLWSPRPRYFAIALGRAARVCCTHLCPFLYSRHTGAPLSLAALAVVSARWPTYCGWPHAGLSRGHDDHRQFFAALSPPLVLPTSRGHQVSSILALVDTLLPSPCSRVPMS
jgi:hypothetical protein